MAKKNTSKTDKNSQNDVNKAIHAFAGMTRLWWHADVRKVLVGNSTKDLDTVDVHIIWELSSVGSTRPSTLATQLGLGAPAITKRLARLSRLSLTETQPAPDDGRALLVSLTPQGKKIATQFQHTARDTFETVTATWSAEEKEIFITLLTRYTAGALDFIATETAE